MEDDLDLQIVASYQTRLEAEVAVAHLETEGIAAMIRPFGGGAGTPTLGFTDGVPVLVPASNLEDAKRVLEDRTAGGDT